MERQRRVKERPHLTSSLSHALLSDPAFSSDPRSHPHFAARLPSGPPALSSRAPSPPPPPAATQPKPVPDPPEAAPARGPSRPVPPHNTNVPREGSMKALVRRLTGRHNLDRIDELDETDPFGVNYHHDGPYEAIGGNPAVPRTYDGLAPRRADIHHSKREVGSPLHPPQYHSPPPVPYVHGQKGLSLHLEPGQILQPNTIYTSPISSIASVPTRVRRQSTTFAIVAQPDHSRTHSLPNPPTRSPEDPIDRPFLFPRAPLQYQLGDHRNGMPVVPPYRHDHNPTRYIANHTEVTTLPPSRHESQSHISHPAPPSFKHTSRKMRATEATVPASSRYDSRHKSSQWLESPYVIDDATVQLSSSVQRASVEPSRVRHLPRRLVMPAPLQSQLPQIQYGVPPAEPVVWQDGHHAVEGVKFEGHSATDTQGSKSPRKKLSAFSEKSTIPRYNSDDTVPTVGNTLSSDADGTTERTRRRRLSKRRSDARVPSS